MAMTMSDEGRRKLGELEGMRLTVYKDVAGFPTIGVGHLLTKDERTGRGPGPKGKPSARQGFACGARKIGPAPTKDAIRSRRAGIALFRRGGPPRPPIFSTKIFIGGNSTLLKLLNKRIYPAVPAQLRRWIYSGGKKCKGLVHRREKEVEMWERAVS